MNRCKCGKEWGEKEKSEMPGTPDKPISGFHFKFKSSTKLRAVDENGDPVHPFDRTDMEIVGCPHCGLNIRTKNGQTTVETPWVKSVN